MSGSSRIAPQGLGDIVDVRVRPLCFCIYSFRLAMMGPCWANGYGAVLQSFGTTVGIESVISVKLEYDDHSAMQNPARGCCMLIESLQLGHEDKRKSVQGAMMRLDDSPEVDSPHQNPADGRNRVATIEAKARLVSNSNRKNVYSNRYPDMGIDTNDCLR